MASTQSELDSSGTQSVSASPILDAIQKALDNYQQDPHLFPQLQHTILHARLAAEKLTQALEESRQEAARHSFVQFLDALSQLENSVHDKTEMSRAMAHLQLATEAVLTAIAPLKANPSSLVRPTLTTPNYQKIELELSRWSEGQVSDSQLLETLDVIEANMEGHRQANREELEDLEGLTEEEQEFTTRCLGAVEEALAGSLAALSTMKLYWQDQDKSHLEKGFVELGPPTQRLIEAFLAMQQAVAVDD